jgi:hypothetical protein
MDGLIDRNRDNRTDRLLDKHKNDRQTDGKTVRQFFKV